MPHGLGVPIKLLHECVGHIICVETILGEMFRGQLDGAEVNKFKKKNKNN